MEGDPAKLRQRVLALLAALGLALVLVACTDDGANDAGSPTTVDTARSPSDPSPFCAQLDAVLDDDPFDEIFGKPNPMQAAAAFDGSERRLDELVATAPADIALAAERYRDAFTGFRLLILPRATIDASSYETKFAQLRAEQDAARALLEAHVADGCESR